MNSKDKGDIAEAFVTARLLEMGNSVSKPFGDNQRYDIIVDNKKDLKLKDIRNRLTILPIN